MAIGGAVGLTAGLLALWAPAALWNGYVLTVLWRWFVVPTFGVAPLMLWQAIGLTMIVGYLTHQYTSADKDGDGLKGLAMLILKPLFALFFGWLTLQLFA